MSTNVALKTFDFDTTTSQAISFVWHPHETWDGSTVTFALLWTNQAGLAAETLDFDLAGRAYADDDAINQSMGTPQNVTDIFLAQNDWHKTAFSSAITITGASNGNGVIFKLSRDVASDNMTGDVGVIAAIIRYGTTDQGST